MATTSRNILEMLLTKHEADVCVPQCKTGPTRGSAYSIMDLWAMAKSWRRPITWAYEIKVSRGDFLRDKKWPSYLGYCNEFYFVSPPGLIAPEELPQDVGLLWAAKTGTRLYTKRKAVYRDVTLPEELWRYIVMRSTIIPEQQASDNVAYWKRWLGEKREKRQLGYRVSREIRSLVTERIEATEAENERLRTRIEKLEDIRRALDAAGVSPFAFDPAERLLEKHKELQALAPKGFVEDLRQVAAKAGKLLKVLEPAE